MASMHLFYSQAHPTLCSDFFSNKCSALYLHRTSELRKEQKEADCHYVAYSNNFLYFTFFLEFFLHFLVLLDIVANFSESGARIIFMILIYQSIYYLPFFIGSIYIITMTKTKSTYILFSV